MVGTRAAWLLVAAVGACGESTAQQGSSASIPEPTVPVDPSLLEGFIAYESKAGRYKVRVPAKPELRSDPLTLGGRTYPAEWVHSTTDGRAVYMAQWNEAPPEASAADFLAKYAPTIMIGVGASVLSMGDTKVLGDIPAVETTGKHPRTGAVYLRVFVVDGGVYRLMTAGVAEARAKAYFASFERL